MKRPKRTIKQKLRDAGIGALGLISGGTAATVPALAAEAEVANQLRLGAKSRIELKANESTTRTGLNLGRFAGNAYVSTATDSTGTSQLDGSGGHITYAMADSVDVPLLGTVQTPKLWLRAEGEDRTVGLDATIAGQYLAPVWTTFDDKGNFVNTGAMAIGSLDLGRGVAIDYGAGHFINPDEHDTQSVYGVLRGRSIAAGAVFDWDDNFRFDIGAGNKDLGTLLDVKWDRENDKVNGILFVAENPCAVLSPQGPRISGNVFGIGELNETKTYLSGTGNKSNDGLAGRLDFTVEGGKLTSIAPELGYNLGQVAGSVGVKFSEPEVVGTGKLSFKAASNVFVETSYSTDGTAKAYLSLTR